MALTFENLIDHNKRLSILLVICITLFIALLGGIFYMAFWAQNPGQALVAYNNGTLWGAGLAVFGAVFAYFAGNRIMAVISGARLVHYHEDRILLNVTEEMAIAAGIPPPKVYVIFDESPNAFASGRDPAHGVITITSGLRKKLSREELQAVIAHEMAHIKNYDTRLLMMVGIYAGIIVLISDFFLRRFLDTSKNTLRGKRGGKAVKLHANHNLAFTIGAILAALFLSWSAPFIAKFLQLAISRQREYLADACAVQFTRNPMALASALQKIAMDPTQLIRDNRAMEHMYIINPHPSRKITNANKEGIWCTHPPVIKRIARLRVLAKDYGQPTPVEQAPNTLAPEQPAG